MNKPMAASTTSTTLAVTLGQPIRPQPSFASRATRLIRRQPIGFIGLIIVLLVLVLAIFAPQIAPFEPSAQAAKRLLPPQR